MTDSPVDALVEVAPDGVEYDGLHATHDADGYTFGTPGETWTGLSEGEFRDRAAENHDFVHNWFFFHSIPSDANRAFLRWVEGAEEHAVPERYAALAEGTGKEWGELHVTVQLDGDDRVYDVRHVRDSDHALGDLDRHDDPLDARELVKYDEKGRYRPLKTAPSLPTGWAFAPLDARDCVQTVEYVYPATVANWYREREGELDISHFRETAERQTGIYGLIEELPEEAVNWVAHACCDDSQCLKRRMWDEDGDTPLDAPRGEGEFPCREPCSLVVAASRKWTKLEEEETHEYTLELTPSEKAQLDDLVNAVADGRIDEIREADVYEGANRYRARYLRAKRMHDGELPVHEHAAHHETGEAHEE
ncbi:DR2241 family protein [Natronomonas sp. EA1]|uniref:DR2241 family protein n=1 Tax=Natronomonas sp. EA1 TaxID=3421655 RepID=UPI003EBC3522